MRRGGSGARVSGAPRRGRRRRGYGKPRVGILREFPLAGVRRDLRILAAGRAAGPYRFPADVFLNLRPVWETVRLGFCCIVRTGRYPRPFFSYFPCSAR